MAAQIPYPAPEGFHWQPQTTAPWWRVCQRPGMRCRWGAGYHHPACGATPTVMEIRRGDSQWWAYCAKHTYGHWIEDGKVWGWRLVSNPPAGAA